MSAVSASSGGSVLRPAELVDRDGVFHRLDGDSVSDYRRRWEDEATEDHVRSAIAGGPSQSLDFETLTGKISPLWSRFPEGRDLGTVLEIGAGYGRIPLYLARERSVTWSTYCAVDISDTMLRRLVEYRARFRMNLDRPLHPICVSADALPLEDDSVDVALTSAVFLHMGKTFVARAVTEIARVLKPGGRFVFDVSFPNAHNPANLLPRLKPQRLRSPNFMKYWTRDEIETLLRDNGLGAKSGGFTIAPGSYVLLPKRVGPLPVPLARRVNGMLGESPRRFRDVLAASYDAYSTGFLA
jgi:SAM-dependent methyltransferase